MKFCVGDKVRLKVDAVSYGAGKIGNLSSFDGRHWWIDDTYCCDEKEMEAVMRTIDDLREGDVVVRNGYKQKVLSILGIVHILSNNDTFNEVSSTLWSVEELKRCSYTLVQPKPAQVTITVDGKETVISRESAESLNLI